VYDWSKKRGKSTNMADSVHKVDLRD